MRCYFGFGSITRSSSRGWEGTIMIFPTRPPELTASHLQQMSLEALAKVLLGLTARELDKVTKDHFELDDDHFDVVAEEYHRRGIQLPP